MRRAGLWVVALGTLLTVSSVGWGAAKAAKVTKAEPPRFRFKTGDVLDYEILFGFGGSNQSVALDMNLQGVAELAVLKVLPNGNAEIKLTTREAGGMSVSARSLGDQTINMGGDDVPPVLLTVKPDGTVLSVKDAEGKPVSTWSGIKSILGGSGLVQAIVFANGTLCGLQLPKALPAAGKTWRGTYRMEIPDASAFEGKSPEELAAMDMSQVEVDIKQLPVTFTYQGTKQYRDRACLAIVSKPKAETAADEAISSTLYFDAAKGQLVGLERHFDYQSMKVDLVFRLASSEKRDTAKPAETPAAPEKPAAETPSSGTTSPDEDYIPIVR